MGMVVLQLNELNFTKIILRVGPRAPFIARVLPDALAHTLHGNEGHLIGCNMITRSSCKTPRQGAHDG